MTQPGQAGRAFPTSIGTSSAETITLLGHDLATDLMGKVSFGELALWLVTQQRPTPSQVRVFEAVLVALADHGFTPTAIAARLTYLSAPDSVQGAIAAGLLGGGSRFLGVTEDAARFLAETLAGQPVPADEPGFDELAMAAIRHARDAGWFVPGLGHPVHKVTDPRTPALLAIAEAEGLRGPHLRLFEAIGRVHPQVLGRRLPLNGAGTCGAALADLGFPPGLLRGFALLARTAGLLGDLAGEMRRPAWGWQLPAGRRAGQVPAAGRRSAATAACEQRQRDVTDPGLTADRHVERHAAAERPVGEGKALGEEAARLAAGMVSRRGHAAEAELLGPRVVNHRVAAGPGPDRHRDRRARPDHQGDLVGPAMAPERRIAVLGRCLGGEREAARE